MHNFATLPMRAMRRALLAACTISVLGVTLSASALSAQSTSLVIGNADDAFAATPFGNAGPGDEASVAMGQTFMRPATCGVTCYLQGFSFWLGTSDGLAVEPEALQFRAYVAEWDDLLGGASTVHFTSDVFTGPMGPSQPFAFSAPNVEMLDGTRYVAFLSVVGVSAGTPSPATADFDVVDAIDHPYADGAWVFTNSGSTIDDLTSNAWDFAGDPEFFQARFEAQFTAAEVPEPSLFALLAVGGIALLFVARRRRA